MEKYKALGHNSIRLEGMKIIYVDPFELNIIYRNDADYIFITHSHYDHLSIDDIRKIIKENTILISPKSGEKELKDNFPNNDLIIVEPDKTYEIDDIWIKTTFAYNNFKVFHPKENNWVGYIIKFEDLKYYIAGDTDFVQELKDITCDIAFLPIGGKYTMDYKEASEMANEIKAKIIIPTHYGTIIGSYDDAEKFADKVIGKKVEIHIK